METLTGLFLHLDSHLADIALRFGPWIYGLLFLIIFAETGLVVTPFLPGDSLLFAAGALSAAGSLNPLWLLVSLSCAAILGDAVNYAAGRFAGPRVFRSRERTGFWQKALNESHLARAREFFERHGGKAIVLARFAPIIRTFVPFVAGCGAMNYSKFVLYNVSGGLAWVGLCIGGGYVFGNVPLVKSHFSLVAMGIVAVSLIPVVLEWMRGRRKNPPPADKS